MVPKDARTVRHRVTISVVPNDRNNWSTISVAMVHCFVNPVQILIVILVARLDVLCRNVSCPFPEKPLHGFVSIQDGVAQYSCQSSYYLLGSPTRTCSTKLVWTESAPLCAADVAAGMPAFISSGVNGSDAFFATDILLADQNIYNYAAIQNDGTCAQTEWEPTPWLIVDLLNPILIDGYNISKLGYIDVQNRHNESQSLEILVGNSSSDMTLNFVCAQYDNIPAVSESGLYLSGYCINGAIGRYIIVRAVSNNPSYNIKLGLCKVVVLSSEALTSVHCPSPAHHRLFGAKCYDIRNTEEMPWYQADSYCTEHNGTLALVDSQVDHDFLTWEIGRNNIRKEAFIQVRSYWLGLRRTSDDHWVTSHGKSPTFDAWANNASTNSHGNFCASIDVQQPSYWSKTNCDQFAGWICEYNITFCGTPATPQGVFGYIPAKDFYSIGDSVSFNCGAIYRKSVEIKIFCLHGGTWSDPESSCENSLDTKPLTCPPLKPSIPNGILIQTNKNSTHQTNNVFEYRCKDGFYMLGNSSLSCMDDGTWSNEVPSCRAQALREPTVLCPKPINVENGSYLLSQDPPKPGAHVLYSCNVGYTLQGGSILTCLPSGSWSSSYPHCQKDVVSSACANFTINNAEIIYLDQDRSVGHRAMVQCRQGYVLRGEPLLWCLPSGNWNTTAPLCDVLTPFLLNGPPKDHAPESPAENAKSGNLTESTWAILVTGLIGAALFVAVVGFAATYLIIKWKRNASKPENQTITYQIGQQMTQEQYNSQLSGSNVQSPPSTPQMPIVYAINNQGGAVPTHANFQFGYASYQLQPVGSTFAYHSSIIRPSKLSMPRRKSVGSASEVSGVSSRQESRRSSEPAPLVTRTVEISLEDPNMAHSCVEMAVSEEGSQHADKDSNEAGNRNCDFRREESDSSIFLSRQTSETNYNEAQHANDRYKVLTCVEVLQCASNPQISSEPASPPVSPLVIRSGYSSPSDKPHTPLHSESISPSPDESPNFVVHISSTTKSGSSSMNSSGVDNPAFVTEEMVLPETMQVPCSRRNSSSSSYLGGSSSDSSHHEHHDSLPLVHENPRPEKPVVPEKPKTPEKRKTSFTVQDLQDEIRNLPLFQRLRKNLGEEEPSKKQHVVTIPSREKQIKKLQTVSFAKPSSPARDPKSSLPPVPKKEPQRVFGRNESSDIDTSTPLAFLDKQFAEDGQFFEETSSDDVMYEKLDQVESPDHDLSHTSEGSSDTQTLQHVNVQIGDSQTDSAENTSLDSNTDMRNFKQHHELQENLQQYYGPSAQLSDSSATTSEDMNQQQYALAHKQNADESSGAEQSPAPYHTRLRRIYTVPNQRNAEYEREVHSENERLSMKSAQRTNQIYPKRSPPIMGTKGLRRIPTTGMDPMSNGSRSEGELENRSKIFHTERLPQATTLATTNRGHSQTRREPSLTRNQPFRKYPNSPRLGRNKPQNSSRPTNEQLRQQKSFTDSEDDSHMPPKQIVAALRSSVSGGKRYRPDQVELAREKDRKRMKPRSDNFEAYLPNDETLLSENFELDQSFFEPVGIRRGGYHRSQPGYPMNVSHQRSRSTQPQRASTSESKSSSGKPRPLPRQNHIAHQTAQQQNVIMAQASKDLEYKRKPNLVTSNNTKHMKTSSVPANNSSSVSWDAKKFKHRHKRVQFKDELDEVIAHSPERVSDDDGAHAQQLPAYHYWRQNLRSTSSNNGQGQKFNVNILSD